MLRPRHKTASGTPAGDPACRAAAPVSTAGGRSRYDPVAIFLHWTTVILVLVQMALAQLWGLSGRPTRHLMVVAHMSFGIILTGLIVVRLIWRLIPSHRVRSLDTGWVRFASSGVHALLYVMLAAQAVLGFLLRWSGGEAMSFFGLSIPPPFAAWSRGANREVGDLHEWNGWAIILVATGHAAAALYHQYVLRDGGLSRMLPRGRERPLRR
ncbi:MAG TPA: cytochrome b [Sphingomicrobium sp.]|nr:cytochrome b [Sphingomicrobium sp.]